MVEKINFSRIIIFILTVLSIKNTYLFANSLGDDDLSYWLFNTSFIFDFDWKFDNEINILGINLDTLGNSTNPLHAYGSSFISIPIVYLFSFLDKTTLSGVIYNPSIVFNSSMYLAYFFTSSMSGFFGIFLLIKSLENLNIIFKKYQILILSLGNSLLYFLVNRFTLNHSYEFLINCIIIFLTTKLLISKKITYVFLISFFIFLGINTRVSNWNILFLPIVINLIYNQLKSTNNNIFLNQKFKTSIFIAANFLFFSLINFIVYGSLVRTKYCISELQCNDIHPYIGGNVAAILTNLIDSLRYTFQFLFSFGPGLFWSNILLFLSLIMIIVNYKKLKINLAYLFSISIPLFTTILWRGRELEFNPRFLVGTIPISVIFFYFVVNQKYSYKKYLNFAIVLACYNIFNQMFYHVNNYVSLSSETGYMGLDLSFSNRNINYDIFIELTNNLFFLPTFFLKSFIGFDFVYLLNLFNPNLLKLISINDKVELIITQYTSISALNFVLMNLFVYFIYKFIVFILNE